MSVYRLQIFVVHTVLVRTHKVDIGANARETSDQIQPLTLASTSMNVRINRTSVSMAVRIPLVGTDVCVQMALKKTSMEGALITMSADSLVNVVKLHVITLRVATNADATMDTHLINRTSLAMM